MNRLSDSHSHVRLVGRGTVTSPANRFERLACESDLEQLSASQLATELGRKKTPTQYLTDESRSFIRENESPDLPFRFSINPYRGCEHGCAYCYARPGHETLGLNAGIDFETKIFVKRDAPQLLRRELNRPAWLGESITVSGVTDCYQPAERSFEVTRRCLEVFAESRQAFTIVTKNALVVRDLDLLADAARQRLTQVNISLATLDDTLCRRMEPRTSVPTARLRAIERLSAAGVPVGVMVSPVIPGLTDHEIPTILRAVRDAGACVAYSTLLRLSLTVLPVFLHWLETNVPAAKERVEALIRECRDGELNDSRFGLRMRGTGPYAANIHRIFCMFRDRLQLDRPAFLDTSRFRPPTDETGQRHLF